MNRPTFRSRLYGVITAAVVLTMTVARHTASKLQGNNGCSPRFSPLTEFVVLITACGVYTNMAIKLAFEVEQPALAGMGGSFGRRDLNTKRAAVHNAWVNLTSKQMKDPPPTREPGAFRIQNGSTGAVGQVQVSGQRPDDSGGSRNHSRH